MNDIIEYQCPACGGALMFDIISQKLRCTYCDGEFDVDNMQKKDLIDKVGLSSTTIAKMGKGEKVSLDVIERVCEHLDCNIGDVISFEKE